MPLRADFSPLYDTLEFGLTYVVFVTHFDSTTEQFFRPFLVEHGHGCVVFSAWLCYNVRYHMIVNNMVVWRALSARPGPMRYDGCNVLKTSIQKFRFLSFVSGIVNCM